MIHLHAWTDVQLSVQLARNRSLTIGERKAILAEIARRNKEVKQELDNTALLAALNKHEHDTHSPS